MDESAVFVPLPCAAGEGQGGGSSPWLLLPSIYNYSGLTPYCHPPFTPFDRHTHESLGSLPDEAKTCPTRII